MADKTYKLTATLSTGEEIDCGTFTAPQGPQGSTIIGHVTASYIPEVTDEEYLSFESLSGVPAVGDTIIVVWSARNGNSALVTAEVIDVNTSGDGELTIIVNSVTNTRGATGAQGPQGPQGATGPAWEATRTYLTKITSSGPVNIPSGYSFIEILVQDDGADTKTPFLISRATLMDTSIAEQIKLPSIDGINDNIYLYATNSTTVYCNSGFSGFSVRFYGIR